MIRLFSEGLMLIAPESLRKNRRHWPITLVLCSMVAFAIGFETSPVHAQKHETTPAKGVKIDDPVPFGQAPIRYHSPETTDRIAAWGKNVVERQLLPKLEPQRGYLNGLLDALEISPHSQILVFSKTAANTRQVAPKTPRAIYFDDEAYVAWIPGSKTLELGAVDPIKGFLFYTLPQDGSTPPRLRRDQSCLTCHISSITLNIPGAMVRSMQVETGGRPYEGYPLTTHDSPYERRFAGWYVTGATENMTHLGNLIGREEFDRHRDEATFRGTLTDLTEFCDLSAYPAKTSDIIPLLVFHHQAQGHNLIIRVGYESRLGIRSDAEDQLFRYLLFLDEPPLPGPIAGDSEYQKWFTNKGPKVESGNSLRDFDLTHRLFRYRLSYLIYSRAFQQLPSDAKSRMLLRIHRALTGDDPAIPDDWHTAEERTAIANLLEETLPEEDWPPVATP